MSDLKPQYAFADVILNILLIATTAFTLSSIIRYSVAKAMKSKKNKIQWIETIHTYRPYDVLALVFAVGITAEFITTNRYLSSQAYWLLTIIYVGLAWGLLLTMIYSYQRWLLVKRMG